MSNNHPEILDKSQDTQVVLIKNIEIPVIKNRMFSGLISLVIIVGSILFSLYFIFHFKNHPADTCVQSEGCDIPEQVLREIPKITSEYLNGYSHSCSQANSYGDRNNKYNKGYYIEDGKVYFDNLTEILVVPEADTETFECLMASRSWPFQDYFYGKDKNNIYYNNKVVVGADPTTFSNFVSDRFLYYTRDSNSVFAAGVKLVSADPKTFTLEWNQLYVDNDGVEKISTTTSLGNAEVNFAQDNSHVYINQKMIPEADPSTYVHLRSGYSRDKNYVYYNGKIIDQADPKTFQEVSKTVYYKDKNFIYYQDKILTDADTQSFKSLLDLDEYAYDKNHYYKNNDIIGDITSKNIKVIEDRYLLINDQLIVGWGQYNGVASEIKIADPLALKSLGVGYFKDSISLYSVFHSPKVFEEADLNTFAIYLPKTLINKDEIADIYYIRNGNTITFFVAAGMGGPIENLIEGVDADTFAPLEFSYSKDVNSVYWSGEIIEGADPKTFRPLNHNYSLDKNAVYAGTQKIAGADPVSFVISPEGWYAYDKNLVYSLTGEWANPGPDVIVNANPEKIETLKISDDQHSDRFVAIDDKNVYYKTQKLEGVNPLELRIELGGLILRDSDTAWYSQSGCTSKGGATYVPESAIIDPENYKSECVDASPETEPAG